MPDTVQLNVHVSPGQRELVNELSQEHGWSVADTVRKAVDALAGLMVLHESTANSLGEELGPIFRQLVREMGPERMVNKNKLTQAVLDNGQAALIIDGYAFYFDDAEDVPEGRLMAMKEIDGRKEVYEVARGKLITVAAFPLPGHPTLN